MNQITAHNSTATVFTRSSGQFFYIESERGKHYCQDGYCSYCEESTPDRNAHRYECAFPQADFTDDQGNNWIYFGVTRTDESPSFGWWHETHRWFCKEEVVFASDPANSPA